MNEAKLINWLKGKIAGANKNRFNLDGTDNMSSMALIYAYTAVIDYIQEQNEDEREECDACHEKAYHLTKFEGKKWCSDCIIKVYRNNLTSTHFN